MTLSRLLLAAAVYLIAFYLFCPYLLFRFSTEFYCDGGDGLQNVWNMWWVNKAVIELHQLPWHTTYLHFPYGTTLLGQTLNPFNGFVGIVLQKFLTLVQAHNTMVVFSFVGGGVTAMMLCFELTGAFFESLVGGAVFTFSEYHFMHAEGHMQLVSLEWLPLFVLLWYRFSQRPSVRSGLVCAFVLFLVLLCDYYYFFYCILFGVLALLWRKRGMVFLRREHWTDAAAFVIPVIVLCGILVGALLRANHRDPFDGAHSSHDFAMDLWAPFVPGGHSIFGGFTQGTWSRFTGNKNEQSVYVGFSVLFLVAWVWLARKRIAVPDSTFWYSLLAFFWIMSLGPTLHVNGKEVLIGPHWGPNHEKVNLLVLPYELLAALIPPLKLSGVPVRMMVMVELVAAILVAAGIRDLRNSPKSRARYLVPGLIAIMVVECLPAPLPHTSDSVPDYVTTLRNADPGGVYDASTYAPAALLYETVHGKPIAYGYMSRIPASVLKEDGILRETYAASDWKRLCTEFHFRYVVAGEEGLATSATSMPVLELSHSQGLRLYQLGGPGQCL